MFLSITGLHGRSVVVRADPAAGELPAAAHARRPLEGQRQPGRPPRRVLRVLREALQLLQVRHQGARRWRRRLQGGDPEGADTERGGCRTH